MTRAPHPERWPETRSNKAMWVFYSISNKRILQLAAQIDPAISTEKVRKFQVKGTGKASLKAKTGKLLDLLGIKGEASAGAEGELSRSGEDKYRMIEESVYDTVCRHLTDEEHSTFIGPKATSATVREIRPLVRFKGHFHPLVSGSNAADQLAAYEKATSVNWEGKCGTITVRLTTTKDSIISSTPVVQYIMNDARPMLMEGFGTLTRKEGRSTVLLLPLFIGLEISGKAW